MIELIYAQQASRVPWVPSLLLGNSVSTEQDRGVIRSISPREGGGPGANPGFLTRPRLGWLDQPPDGPHA